MTVVERISALPEELRLEIFGRCSLGELMILANVNQKARQLVKSRMRKLCLHVPGELHDLDQTSLRTLRYICADTTRHLIVLLPEARCLSEQYDPEPFNAADLQWKTLTSVMAKMSRLSGLYIGNPSCLDGNFEQSMKLAEMLTAMLMSTELRVNHLQIWATEDMIWDILSKSYSVLSWGERCGEDPIYPDFAKHMFGRHPQLEGLEIHGGKDGTNFSLTRGECDVCNCGKHTTYVKEVPFPGGISHLVSQLIATNHY